MLQNLTRQDVVKFFTKNKKSKIVFEQKDYFWDSWNISNFLQDPLINNILSCILSANDDLKYDKYGNIIDETTTNQFGAFVFTKIPPGESILIEIVELVPNLHLAATSVMLSLNPNPCSNPEPLQGPAKL